jgi:glycosyltransferase involved in cell wall biosynthesis
MDRANLELARYLAIDQQVHLVAHRVENEIAQLANVTVHRVPRPLGKHLLGQPLLARAGRKWAARLARAGYRVVVNGGNCEWADINWVHYVHAAAPPPDVPGALRRGIAAAGRRLALWEERRALRSARVAVCNSRRTARDVVERLGIDPERVKVVYLGADPDRFSFVTPSARSEARARLGWDDRPWAVFVGALGDTRKGFDTLYDAWRALCRDASWEANLAVVGAGARLSAWKERAVADGLGGRVNFLGFRHDVPDILAASDVLVHPARYEPYGMGVEEALCRGLPAIVSAAAGVSERYPADLRDLILNDPESPLELAERLRYWLANAESLAARVRPFGDRLRARTWVDMAREIVETVTGAPAQRRPTPAVVATSAVP